MPAGIPEKETWTLAEKPFWGVMETLTGELVLPCGHAHGSHGERENKICCGRRLNPAGSSTSSAGDSKNQDAKDESLETADPSPHTMTPTGKPVLPE